MTTRENELPRRDTDGPLMALMATLYAIPMILMMIFS